MANTELDEAIECVQRSMDDGESYVFKIKLEAEIYGLQKDFVKALEILDKHIESTNELSKEDIGEFKSQKAYLFIESKSVDEAIELILSIRDEVNKKRFLV